MLRERIAFILLLLPIFVWVIVEGDWLFACVVSLILGWAALEYGRLFQRGKFRPSLPILVFGSAGLGLSRFAFQFSYSEVQIVGLILLALLWHLLSYERGVDTAAVDLAITLAGILYLGWLGGYLISLRMLEDGQWWVLLALPVVWLADTAAYFTGKAIGRHTFSPRLSPKKTWEGYIAGIFAAILAGFALTHLWLIAAGPSSSLTPQRGLVLGMMIGSLAPIGDLAVSMVKRQFLSKDTSKLIPGHGGVLDRIDSWLWAGVLGYYVALWVPG